VVAQYDECGRGQNRHGRDADPLRVAARGGSFLLEQSRYSGARYYKERSDEAIQQHAKRVDKNGHKSLRPPSFKWRACRRTAGLLRRFAPRNYALKRYGIWLNHHRALASCLSMIFSENRYTLFRIVL
jgi:hypothetical protein